MRIAARKTMRDAADGKQGVACGWIGAAQFTDEATALTATMIPEIATSSGDLCHVADYPGTDFLKAIEGRSD